MNKVFKKHSFRSAFFLIDLFLFFILKPSISLAYHSTDRQYGPLNFSHDTHSAISEDAYTRRKISKTNYPDLERFKKTIFEGDSDEAMAHQGSDILAESYDNQFAWFGSPELHWKQVLLDYKQKKYLEAYHRIGAMLHLTADATVPTHIRICPHGAGTDYYFGTDRSSRADEQKTFKNSYKILTGAAYLSSPVGAAIIDHFGWLFPLRIHVDGFEKTVDEMAVKKEIKKLPIDSRILPSPDVYVKVAREATKYFLDRDSYWEKFWQKKSDYTSWGSYGENGDIFGKKLSEKDKEMVNLCYNLAVAYTSGQMQVISKKLPPIVENLTLKPAKFAENGTKLSFLVYENRTKTVKVKITVNNGPAIVETNGLVYDGFTLNLHESNKNDHLPYYARYEILWAGNTSSGKIKPGKGEITLEVIDEDLNHSEKLTIPFEYLGKEKKGKILPTEIPTKPPDKSIKTVGQAPAVNSFSYTQLHKDYEEIPHRYQLKVEASDPENSPLTYSWNINCGYFFGPTNGSEIEWRYNTPGECIDAVVTVSVKDNEGLTAEKTQRVF